MRLGNLLKTGVLSAALSTSAVSCQKAPLREMPAKYVTETVANRLDSIASETQRVLADTNYKCFGYDTIELTKEFFKNPAKFIKKMNNKAVQKTPSTCVGVYTTTIPVSTGKITVLTTQVHSIYEDDFLKPKAIIRSPKIFTRDSVDMYVPTEYWGKPNPKVK